MKGRPMRSCRRNPGAEPMAEQVDMGAEVFVGERGQGRTIRNKAGFGEGCRRDRKNS